MPGRSGSVDPIPRLRRWVLGLGVLVAGLGPAGELRADTVRQSGHAGFTRRPPRVESLELQLAGDESGPARVFVRFAPDPRLRDTLTIESDAGPLRLTAEEGAQPGGSRTFTGTTRIDVRALEAHQKQLEALAARLGRPLRTPVFEGRVRVDVKPTPIIDWHRLLTRERVRFDPLSITPDEIDTEASLLVRNTGVVRDPSRTWEPCGTGGTPMGKWTFGYLMQQLAGANDPAALTRAWLGTWETAQTVNGVTVAPRGNMRSLIIDPWPRTSAPGQPLDLAQAPFRLLAIVNRIDLAENLAYGPGSGGELRFVFGAVSKPPQCTPLNFTVIFEYALPMSGCKALKSWAKAWVDLAQLTPGTAAYNAALEALTEQVVPAGKAPAKPNGSALAQLRTNEIALLVHDPTKPSFWELREFHLGATALDPVVVRRAPDPPLNATATVADWVNANASDVLADDYEIPLKQAGGTAFAGGDALMAPTTFWAGSTATPITDPEARRHFSLNACSGCHSGETATNFAHVKPDGALGTPAALSGFLTGIDAPVPLTSTTHHYEDLTFRAQALAHIANNDCALHIIRVPNLMVE